MTIGHFDDRNITWHAVPGLNHLRYNILNIDERLQLVDVLFRFAANQKVVLHRHVADNNTFVIQGEHRLYHPDGQLKEVRPVGSYTVSPASPDPHREGGGDEDVIILFGIRGKPGAMYEVLDDDHKVVAALGMADFIALRDAQTAR